MTNSRCKKQWAIHLDNLSKYLKSFCICKYCSGELELEEIVSARAALATKFLLKCKQPNCDRKI